MNQIQVERPNVIVFFTDQQRWDTSGLHGNPMGLTPNYDRMAQRGTHLSHMFTCQPVCGPARSCVQTGLYATKSGCFTNGIPLPTQIKTLGHYFQEANYRTGYIGKWHLAAEEPVPPHKREGYDYWLASNGLEHTSEPYHTVLYNHNGEPVKLPGYRVDAVTDAAIDYINQHQYDPFFLFVSYLEPHHQNRTDDYPAPDGYREKYRTGWIPPDLAALGGTAHQHLGGYYGMVKRLDEALGRMLDALKSLNLLDDTIILFTSDHACHFKTRNEEYKRSCHDASIRIPGTIQGPGFDQGGHVKQLISLIDVAPTLLDAVGISVPAEMQGRSIVPLLQGETEHWQDEVFVQISESQVGRAIRTQKWKYSVSAPDKRATIDAGSDRYVEEFLYDLEADPYELNNLIGYKSHRIVCDYLKERLIQQMVKAGEVAPTIDNAPERESGQHIVKEEEIYL